MMDPEKYRDAVLENKDRVFSHAMYLLRRQEDAEDATQEVFVRLWKHRDKITSRSVKAWIMQTAHNLCIDFLRQRQTQWSRMREHAGTNIDSVAAGADRHSDPREQYEFTRKQEDLLSAMETLPPRTRSMLLLHYFHGFKYEAIAEILETKVGAVRVAVHRGRRALKDLLSGSTMEAGREGHYEDAMQ